MGINSKPPGTVMRIPLTKWNLYYLIRDYCPSDKKGWNDVLDYVWPKPERGMTGLFWWEHDESGCGRLPILLALWGLPFMFLKLFIGAWMYKGPTNKKG